MRYTMGRTAIAACAAAMLAGCTTPATEGTAAMPEAPMAVDLRDHRIDVRLGQAFEVRLPGNPSTGYRWRLVDPVPALVRQVGVARVDLVGGGVGAPAQEVFTFEAAGPGVAPLGFEYRRSADLRAEPPAQRANFRVEVR